MNRFGTVACQQRKVVCLARRSSFNHQPVLDYGDIAKLRNISAHTGGKFKSHELNICYPVAWGKEGIEARLASLQFAEA